MRDHVGMARWLGVPIVLFAVACSAERTGGPAGGDGESNNARGCACDGNGSAGSC